ncbi:hypothetical protein HanXRQr2_Chr17g0809911 [Helianthus annuus]|uniref:Uncharacterized protein n=1 Tax=Helianthus annuus TaxID=4232 RepID=A0A9K3GUK5_HELAN|nr:hypothetical protein HanXRQr2_Chr17g0809911 [Helianthus annuus]
MLYNIWPQRFMSVQRDVARELWWSLPEICVGDGQSSCGGGDARKLIEREREWVGDDWGSSVRMCIY